MATVEQKRERGNKGMDRKGLWRNGNASDYESEDCRFDPCQARLFIKNKGSQRETKKIKEKKEARKKASSRV